VYGWLKKARQLDKDLGGETDLQVCLALATWHKGTPPARGQTSDPDVDLVLELTSGLTKKLSEKPTPDLDYPSVLLVRAAAHLKRGSEEGLQEYLNAFEFLKKAEGAAARIPNDRINQAVLEPAIASGQEVLKQRTTKSPDGFRRKLAQVYSAQGELFQDNPRDFKDALVLALASYDEAARLDPAEPRLAVKKLVLRVDLRKGTPAELLKEAEDAARVAPSEPGPHYVRGKLLRESARLTRDKHGRLEKLRATIEAYEAGIRLYDGKTKRGPDREFADLLVSGSEACLHLGNDLHIDGVRPSEEEVKAFHLARDLARKATQIGDRRYAEFAQTALGNALEDLALFLKENTKENYGSAAEAFTAAKNDQPNLPKSWLDLGRAQYRWFQFGDGP